MGLGGISRRRWIGAAVLGAALLMLVLGQSALATKLGGVVFLVYWLICFGLTGLAIVIALVDARATRAELRKENRELLEQAVKDIQEEALARRRRDRH